MDAAQPSPIECRYIVAEYASRNASITFNFGMRDPTADVVNSLHEANINLLLNTRPYVPPEARDRAIRSIHNLLGQITSPAIRERCEREIAAACGISNKA